MNIENKIRDLLESVDEKTPAQMSYPGATGPQDPAPYMGVNFEELELDRPGVVTDEIQQVQYPGQTMPDPMNLGPEYQELDPYNMAPTIQEVPKENYPIGSGADDVQSPQDPAASMQPDEYSAGITPAQHPAPFVAEETEGEDQSVIPASVYQSYKPAKVSAKAQGQHIVVLDKNTASAIEKKLGLPKGALSPVQGGRYSETVVVKGKDNKLHTVYAKDDTVRTRSYGHDDQASTQALADHLNEATNFDDFMKQATKSDFGNFMQHTLQSGALDKQFSDFSKSYLSKTPREVVNSHPNLNSHVIHAALEARKFSPDQQQKVKDYLSKVIIHTANSRGESTANNIMQNINGVTDGVIKISHDDLDEFQQGGTRHHELNESLDVGQQQVDPVDQQNEVLQQAVQAVQAGNKIEDVAKATGLDVQAIQAAIEAAQPTASPSAPQSVAPVSESSLKQDVQSILGEETLSEEFKSKAAALFESTVVSRVNEEVKRLEEAYDSKLSTEIKSLQEQYIHAVETFAEKQSTRLNSYINYLGEQWIKQNRVALHQGIRTDLTEGFMKGLQKLFTEHYINVPTEKVDLVAEQKAEIQKLQESIAEMESKVETLEESNHILQREAVIMKVSEGLTDTEAAKLNSLCEGVSFESEDLFESKINMIKNNFFKRKAAPSPEQLLESTIHTSHEEDKKVAIQTPNMERYIAALNKFKQ